MDMPLKLANSLLMAKVIDTEFPCLGPGCHGQAQAQLA
jgi:hypothetical protein